MKKAKKYLSTILGVTVGNALVAFGILTFYEPYHFATGGATGVGLLLYWLFEIDTSLTVLLINVLLLLLSRIFIGRTFALSSVLGSLLYPLFLKVFRLLPSMTGLAEDKLTAALCAGLLIGFGVGLTLRVGSSTGGTDTLAVLFNRVFRVPVMATKLIADYGVMILGFIFVAHKSVLYSLLALAVETLVMNRVMLLGRSQLQLLIVTDRHQEIRDVLMRELERGVTMLSGEFGLRRTACQVILCVIPKKKLYVVKERIHDVDPGAFVTVAEVKEVRGQGFTEDRIPQPFVPVQTNETGKDAFQEHG